MNNDQLSSQTTVPPLVLSAKGFTLQLTPRAPYHDSTIDTIFFKADIVLETTASTQKFRLETFMEAPLQDLTRLHELLESHIHQLTQHMVDWNDQASVDNHFTSLLTGPALESPTWVPLELELQITCLDGELSYEKDQLVGTSGIRIMVQLPQPDAISQSHVYAGCEGTADLQDLQSFCAALRSCIHLYNTLQG